MPQEFEGFHTIHDNVLNALSKVRSSVELTQEEYDNLPEYDDTVLYKIIER